MKEGHAILQGIVARAGAGRKEGRAEKTERERSVGKSGEGSQKAGWAVSAMKQDKFGRGAGSASGTCRFEAKHD